MLFIHILSTQGPRFWLKQATNGREGAAVFGRHTLSGKAGAMGGHAIALILRPVIARILRVKGHHHVVACVLGDNGRRRDGGRTRVTANHRLG